MKKLLVILLSLIIFGGCGIVSLKKPETQKASSSFVNALREEEFYKNISNKKQGWGMRKTENGPEFTKEQEEQMEKYDCIYRGSKKGKSLYLTFDEGYENGYTSVILDVLRKRGIPAAFFVTGAYVRDNPELIKRMADEGHIIGNHSLNHPSLPDLPSMKEVSDELCELDRLVYNITGSPCTYFRPPMGEYSERILQIASDMEYKTAFWSFAYVDWQNTVSKEEAEREILKGLHPGGVLLLHAVSKGNAEALCNIIEKAEKEGYTFKSLDEYS